MVNIFRSTLLPAKSQDRFTVCYSLSKILSLVLCNRYWTFIFVHTSDIFVCLSSDRAIGSSLSTLDNVVLVNWTACCAQWFKNS